MLLEDVRTRSTHGLRIMRRAAWKNKMHLLLGCSAEDDCSPCFSLSAAFACCTLKPDVSLCFVCCYAMLLLTVRPATPRSSHNESARSLCAHFNAIAQRTEGSFRCGNPNGCIGCCKDANRIGCIAIYGLVSCVHWCVCEASFFKQSQIFRCADAARCVPEGGDAHAPNAGLVSCGMVKSVNCLINIAT